MLYTYRPTTSLEILAMPLGFQNPMFENRDNPTNQTRYWNGFWIQIHSIFANQKGHKYSLLHVLKSSELHAPSSPVDLFLRKPIKMNLCSPHSFRVKRISKRLSSQLVCNKLTKSVIDALKKMFSNFKLF